MSSLLSSLLDSDVDSDVNANVDSNVKTNVKVTSIASVRDALDVMVMQESTFLSNVSSTLADIRAPELSLPFFPSLTLDHFNKRTQFVSYSDSDCFFVLSVGSTSFFLYSASSSLIHSHDILSFLSTLIHNTPPSGIHKFLPISPTLLLAEYDSSLLYLPSLLQSSQNSIHLWNSKTHALPDGFDTTHDTIRFYLWQHCGNSDQWLEAMRSLQSSLSKRVLEAFVTGMGTVNADHMAIDSRTCACLRV